MMGLEQPVTRLGLGGTFNRRQLLGYAGAGILLAACGGDDEESAAPTTTSGGSSGTTGATATTAPPATTAAGTPGPSGAATPSGSGTGVTPKMGGELIMSYAVAVQDTLNQHFTNNTNSLMNARHVLDQLAVVDPANGEIKPWLSDRWETSSDGLVYTFHLRSGVKFHNGVPFNANAVKANFDITMDPNVVHGFIYSGLGGESYESTEVVDELTARVTLSKPFPSLLTYLAGPGTGFDEPEAYRAAGDAYGQTTMVGTGPWKFVQYVPKTTFALEKNSDYNWGAPIYKHQGPVYLDKLTFQDIAENATRAAAVQNGDVHAAQITEAQAAQFKDNKDVRLEMVPKAGTARMYLMNTAQAPTDDLKVRQAISHAIDKAALIKLPAWAGIGRPAIAPLPANLVPQDIYNGLKQYDYAYDPVRAGQILDEAGWRMGSGNVRSKDGNELALDWIVLTSDVPQVEPVVGMLQQVGIKSNLVTGDFNFVLEAVKKPFHMMLFSGSGYDAIGLVYRFFSSKGIFAFYGSDPELDAALEATVTATNRDDVWRNLSRSMQLTIQQARAVFAWEQDYIFAIRNEVKDVAFNEWGFPYFYDAWLDE